MSFRFSLFLCCCLAVNHVGSNSISCGDNGCDSTIISCTDNEDCTVTCSGSESCRSSTINCPSNGQCTVNCDGQASCQLAIINGAISDYLTIQGCLSTNSCWYTKIYCPIGCSISGGDSLFSHNIYAVNGFNDITFSLSAAAWKNYEGILHCGPAPSYVYACTLNTVNYLNPVCSGSTPYACMPTSSPTYFPTLNPSVYPSVDPTVDPSGDPTANPSLSPTVYPSVDPTINPTLVISNDSSTKLERIFSNNLSLIIGLVVGFVTACVLCLVAFLYLRKIKQIKNTEILNIIRNANSIEIEQKIHQENEEQLDIQSTEGQSHSPDQNNYENESSSSLSSSSLSIITNKLTVDTIKDTKNFSVVNNIILDTNMG